MLKLSRSFMNYFNKVRNHFRSPSRSFKVLSNYKNPFKSCHYGTNFQILLDCISEVSLFEILGDVSHVIKRGDYSKPSLDSPQVCSHLSDANHYIILIRDPGFRPGSSTMICA